MSKVLVAYFSATGITKGIGKRLAEILKADVYEIVPEVPYTKEDLDWEDKNSRSSIEMDDRSSRPAIANTLATNKLESVETYDYIYLGFPIWWYREPSIIDTFIEKYDFSGKTIIPFATSGGTDMDDSSPNIQKLAPGATVTEGTRFKETVSDDDLRLWAIRWM